MPAGDKVGIATHNIIFMKEVLTGTYNSAVLLALMVPKHESRLFDSSVYVSLQCSGMATASAPDGAMVISFTIYMLIFVLHYADIYISLVMLFL